MREKGNDAMKYVQVFGRPHLFLTMTANPTWKEIVQELAPGQTASERHELVARVFSLKVELLKKLLYKDGIFGKRIANAASIEWQKRPAFLTFIAIKNIAKDSDFMKVYMNSDFVYSVKVICAVKVIKKVNSWNFV